MNRKTEIEQMLEAAAAVPVSGAGLKSAEEVKNEFRRQLEGLREVPYLEYFLRSAAIITMLFALLFLGCLNRGERSMEKGSRAPLMLACLTLKTLNGDLIK